MLRHCVQPGTIPTYLHSVQLSAYSDAVTAAPTVIDRRSARKRDHHAALINAAISLLEDNGGERFTVDQLAERAGVSRRTVFNHFESLDDALAQAGSTVLSAVLDDLLHTAHRRLGHSHEDSMVADLTTFLTTSDLVTPLAYLTRILGGYAPEEPWRVALMHQSVTRVALTMGNAMAERYPDVERLRIDLFMASIAGGLVTIYEHWHRATGALDTPDSRQVWDAMLANLVSSVRHGHTHH